MSSAQALAARRALVAAMILAATLAAHAVATGGLALTRFAPFALALIVGLFAIMGRRHGALTPRGPGRALALLVAGQAVAHAAMTVAPWAFGIAAHHRDPLVTAPGLAAHALAAIVLTVLLVRAERLLAAAVAVVASVRRLLAPRRPRATRPPTTVLVARRRPRPSGVPRVLSARGPPPAASPA